MKTATQKSVRTKDLVHLKEKSKPNIYTLGYAYFLTNTVEPNVLTIFDLNATQVELKGKTLSYCYCCQFHIYHILKKRAFFTIISHSETHLLSMEDTLC